MFRVIGPSPLERDMWIVYLPQAQTLVEVDAETGERLWLCEHYGRCEEVKSLIDYFNYLKPNSTEDIGEPEILYIIVSGKCNLSCTYCYATRGSYGDVQYNTIMKEDMAKKISEIVETFPSIKTVAFFGGEPLMAYRTIMRILKELDKVRNDLKYTINTNCTILNNEILTMLLSYKFSVTVSIDGWEAVHNMHRRILGNWDSYNLIVKNITRLKEHNIPVSAEATYHPDLYTMGVTPYKVALHISRLTPHITVGLASNFPTNKFYGGNILHAIYLLGDYLNKSLLELTHDTPNYLEDAIHRFLAIITNRIYARYRCRFYKILSIMPNGDIYPRNLLITAKIGKLGNINSTDIKALRSSLQEALRNLMPTILAHKPHHQFFDICPIPDFVYSSQDIEVTLQNIYDELLLTFYVISKNGSLSKVVENINKFRYIMQGERSVDYE